MQGCVPFCKSTAEVVSESTGISFHDCVINLKPTLCAQCAQRLINFSRFRDKSLRACALMMDLVEKHELITVQHADIFNKMNTQLKHNLVPTVLKPDHCELYVNTDKLSIVKPVVKSEVSESMSVDEDVTEHNVVVRNENTENSLNINLVVTMEEHVR